MKNALFFALLLALVFGANVAVKYTGHRPGTADWYSTSTYTYDTEGYPVRCAVNVSNGNSYTLLYQFK